MSRFSKLLSRSSVAVGGILLFAAVLVPDLPRVVPCAFFALIGLLAGLEAARLFSGAGRAGALEAALSGACCAIIVLALSLLDTGRSLVAVALPFALVGLSRVPEWSGRREPRRSAAGLAGIIALYGLGLGLLARHRVYSTDFHLLLVPLLICWVGDSAAYFAGSLGGRHKLAPSVSPAKSWEGLAGQIVGSAAGAVVAGSIVSGLALPGMLALGVAGGLLATLGDLLESSVKRGAGVKDSGSLLPGHGGVLDRFDSLVLVSPLTWLWLQSAAGTGL